MIAFPMQATRQTLIHLGTLTAMASQIAEFITADRTNAIKLMLDSQGIPESEYREAARQLAIGYCLGNPARCSLDPERVEWVADLLVPKREVPERKTLMIWPTNPFAGIVFAASSAAALISLAFFLTGHPFLGAWSATGTAAGYLASLHLNGNFK